MNPFRREEYEERQYPVSGRNLRGYKGAFERAGFPAQVTPGNAPGLYIIVVTLPASMPQEIDPYQLPPRRRAWGRWDAAAVLRGVAYAAIAFAVTWTAWQMFAPAAAPTLAGVPVEVGGMALDGAADGAQDGGWLQSIRWPWQDAQDSAQETAGAVQDAAGAVMAAATAAMWVFGFVAVLGALWFVRGIFNRR